MTINPQPKQDRKRGSDDGFTLLEVLVSLVLLSLLLTALPTALRLGQAASRIQNRIERTSVTSAAVTFVQNRLSEAMPIYRHTPDGLLAIAFKGGPNSVTFVAPMSGSEARTGLYLFSLSSLPASGHSAVALEWSAFRSRPERSDSLNPVEQRTILPDAADFALRYFGPTASNKAGEWSDSWNRRDALPTLIELSYKSPSAAQGLLARRIELPLSTP